MKRKKLLYLLLAVMLLMTFASPVFAAILVDEPDMAGKTVPNGYARIIIEKQWDDRNINRPDKVDFKISGYAYNPINMFGAYVNLIPNNSLLMMSGGAPEPMSGNIDRVVTLTEADKVAGNSDVWRKTVYEQEMFYVYNERGSEKYSRPYLQLDSVQVEELVPEGYTCYVDGVEGNKTQPVDLKHDGLKELKVIFRNFKEAPQEPEETEREISITVKKEWRDLGNTRLPDDVEVTVEFDGQTIDTLKLNANNNWQSVITTSFKIKPDEDAQKAIDDYIKQGRLVIKEKLPEGFKQVSSGLEPPIAGTLGVSYKIVNTADTPDKTSVLVPVYKIWEGDQPADRPESIGVDLLKDGRIVGSTVLTSAGSQGNKWIGNISVTTDENTVLDENAKLKENGWELKEKVPEGYVIKEIKCDGGILKGCTIVNKKNEGPPALIKDDHFDYMQGYPDETFRPNNPMTRAEVTVMFCRLLVEQMDVNETYPNSFSDVPGGKWYTNQIGYMERFGIIKGFPDGTFRPDAPVTRAQFAAIASRFDHLTDGPDAGFSDVPNSHWAKRYIDFAVQKGWVSGMGDGTFRPEQDIKRCEVVKITNRLLERYADAAFIGNHKGDIKYYTDVSENEWFYLDVHESSNAHDFDRNPDNSETWLNLRPSGRKTQ